MAKNYAGDGLPNYNRSAQKRHDYADGYGTIRPAWKPDRDGEVIPAPEPKKNTPDEPIVEAEDE